MACGGARRRVFARSEILGLVSHHIRVGKPLGAQLLAIKFHLSKKKGGRESVSLVRCARELGGGAVVPYSVHVLQR